VEPGTRRTATRFTRCLGCGRVYWRGAHARRLDDLIAAATASCCKNTDPAPRRRWTGAMRCSRLWLCLRRWAVTASRMSRCRAPSRNCSVRWSRTRPCPGGRRLRWRGASGARDGMARLQQH